MSTATKDLLEMMQETSKGWMCRACFIERGRIYQHLIDGTPMSEKDRCPGCGELICDRHSFVRGEHPHTIVSHVEPAEPRRRVIVTEVKN